MPKGASGRRWLGFLFLATILCSGMTPVFGADLGPYKTEPALAEPAPLPAASGWTYRFTPYGWLISVDGTQTLRGRSVDIDASFFDVVENSDSLIALMGAFEARRGPLAVYGDLVWMDVGFDGSATTPRGIGVSANLDFTMTIIESGASYEVARWGPGGDTALDLYAGARYWRQSADLTLDLDAAPGLQLERSRSGAVEWVDPLVGIRLRHDLAPGQALFVRGDVGGFGVSSDFSWQALAAYSWDFATRDDVTYSGLVGYRAISVDYSKGSGDRRFEFDAILHGPAVGLSMRF